jgi:hypothetical protein
MENNLIQKKISIMIWETMQGARIVLLSRRHKVYESRRRKGI